MYVCKQIVVGVLEPSSGSSVMDCLSEVNPQEIPLLGDTMFKVYDPTVSYQGIQ